MSTSLSKRLRGAAAGGAVFVGVAAGASDARAFDPFLVTPDPSIAERSPAYRYANASDDAVFAELDRRGILYQRVGLAPGVRAPIRLAGRLHGVHIHSSLPPEQRATTPFEILDGRLALALDDFAAVLERHGIDEVIHYTMYRPNVAPPAAPTAKLAPRSTPPAASSVAPSKPGSIAARKRHDARRPVPTPDAGAPTVVAKSPAATKPAAATAAASELHRTSWAPPGTRHPAGLAIDVGVLHQKSGRWINVGAKFHGAIGDKTCGPGARAPDDVDARELRTIVCEAGTLGIFTYVLTPNYNAAHADHFHMEIKPGVRWFLIH